MLADALDPTLLARLREWHFDPQQLERFAGRIGQSSLESNRVRGKVEPPRPDDVPRVPRLDAADRAERELAHRALELGRESLARGEVASIVLAGGMATRMGGVVKALVPVIGGMSFLQYRLREIAVLRQQFRAPLPLWLMTSFATDATIANALDSEGPLEDVGRFVQDTSVRLLPDGSVFRGADGAPSVYATGHGDLPDALRRSSFFSKFVERGGRYVWIANIDNLGAGVDPLLLGLHRLHGDPLTVEVVPKLAGDRGGIPARLDGRPVVLEEFRLPRDFDPATVPTFNTNTFLVDAAALAGVRHDWTYFEVRKKVDGNEVVQFERLLGELTSALPTRFLEVPRTGEHNRFLPVKDHAELEVRRPEIELVARSRGVLT